MRDLFDEIEEQKKELPKLKKISKEMSKKRHYNFYQQLSFWLFAIFFVIAILLGNIFPACSETSGLFQTCTTTEYNLSLTLIVWFASFIFCSFVYGLGEIISLLTSINEKIK